MDVRFKSYNEMMNWYDNINNAPPPSYWDN